MLMTWRVPHRLHW